RYGRGALSLSEYRRRKWRFLARYGLFLAVQRLKPSRHGDREFHEFHQREIEYAIAEAQREPMLGKILLAYRRLFLERPQPSLNRP
ncbi:MAG TPA: hypothetical protein VF937_13750, partial [Chloroflexota bacterium]